MPKSAAATTFAVFGSLPALVAGQQRAKREQVRWLSLLHLDAARPQQMADAALLPLVQSVYADVTTHELRRELDYLAEHGLLVITAYHELWRLKLTYQGIDIVEYTTPCPPGIGRPTLPG
ncbi:hypothetical protein PY257_00635 [Ramlibacter sp. H39-3-26]|uniref:hypothetical protein n=1 Tax=Curvibacter soli TaxID=3031331 RepID=UPI0023D97955|nr:hypothetical protein [Ramlibacter sp. H39-3-26]MDF1483712.1 hypothetical protein [Ramlibacter sp. H39-3-26]